MHRVAKLAIALGLGLNLLASNASASGVTREVTAATG